MGQLREFEEYLLALRPVRTLFCLAPVHLALLFPSPGVPLDLFPCWRSGCGVDIHRAHRLKDERPGLSFLVQYARAMCLLCGLCSLDCVPARREALSRRIDNEFRANMLTEPAIRSFLALFNGFFYNELPIVFGILRQDFVPGLSGSMPFPCYSDGRPFWTERPPALWIRPT